MQQLNYVFANEDIKLYQDDELFKMSLDSVLLCSFLKLKKNTNTVLDIGTGNAPIPLLLSKKYSGLDITAVEIQKKIYALAKKNIELNDKDIKLINDDINNIYLNMGNEVFDIITCNPPYFEYKENNYINKKSEYALSRHELSLKIEDIMKISKRLLKNRGSLVMVHRPDYLIKIIEMMRLYSIEPKRIKFIYPKKNKESNIMLIEGIKNGNRGIKIEEPLFVYVDNQYSDELYNYLK